MVDRAVAIVVLPDEVGPERARRKGWGGEGVVVGGVVEGREEGGRLVDMVVEGRWECKELRGGLLYWRVDAEKVCEWLYVQLLKLRTLCYSLPRKLEAPLYKSFQAQSSRSTLSSLVCIKKTVWLFVISPLLVLCGTSTYRFQGLLIRKRPL